MPSVIQADLLKDASATKTLATLSSSAVTLHNDVALPSGTMCGFTETTTTPTAAQGSDTSYTTLTGSNVNYTPVSGSSFVVYDYTTCFTNSHNNSLIYFKFLYDGSPIANTNHAFYAKFGDGDAGLGYKNFRFVLPSWSGSKELKVTYRVHTSTYTARIHKSSYSGDSTGDDVYVNIYRQTYSVM
tara:strand:- start:299 stop:853 length:555 start_codon:yes stop_codon:yes gene_type:complete